MICHQEQQGREASGGPGGKHHFMGYQQGKVKNLLSSVPFFLCILIMPYFYHWIP
uniref:Uncharacterized protein n=1 Tax=Arundo donax TaxID=35708 RepID=A0A0A9GVY3_ARUDO